MRCTTERQRDSHDRPSSVRRMRMTRPSPSSRRRSMSPVRANALEQAGEGRAGQLGAGADLLDAALVLLEEGEQHVPHAGLHDRRDALVGQRAFEESDVAVISAAEIEDEVVERLGRGAPFLRRPGRVRRDGMVVLSWRRDGYFGSEEQPDATVPKYFRRRQRKIPKVFFWVPAKPRQDAATSYPQSRAGAQVFLQPSRAELMAYLLRRNPLT